MDAADHFTTELPTKRMAADCLIVDGADRFLVVQPTYKDTWDVPGGVVEQDESPRNAARREIREELGVTLEPGRLLAVDWIARDGEATELVAFLFDGGQLDGTPDALILQPDEIRAARFVTLADASSLLDAEALARVTSALAAKARQHIAYLENGHQPDAR